MIMSIRSKAAQVSQYPSRFRLLRNRWFLPITAIVTTLVVLFNWPQIANGAEKVADRLVLYVHVAELYTKDPDRRLAMPLAEVEKKQVANTWHAPRSGNRLHEGQDRKSVV